MKSTFLSFVKTFISHNRIKVISFGHSSRFKSGDCRVRDCQDFQQPPRTSSILAWQLVLVAQLCLFSTAAEAQLPLSVSNVYHIPGEYSISYFRSNIDLSLLIGNPGSNYWDFSQTQAINDIVSRMDVVPVSDGGHQGSFTGSSFAWRYMNGAIQGTSWEYYSLDSTNGLIFYGTYYPVGYSAVPSVPITPPASILPKSLAYGDTWNTSYQFDVVDPLFGDVPGLYEATVIVDAYGAMRLPNLAEVPALRIAQSETYYEYDLLFGTWDLFQQDTNWLWLAAGVGFGAQAVSYAPNAFSITAQPYTNSFSRVCANPMSHPAPNVSISLNAGSVLLSWNSISNATGYLVEQAGNLTAGIWVPIAQTTNRSWQDQPPNSPQGFYRVRAQQ